MDAGAGRRAGRSRARRFLGEVARRRADPEKLPGLAAQIPDSPLVQWLHAAGGQIPGDLRVVAGDIEGDSVDRG